MSEKTAPPTEDEVYEHIDRIPPKLRKCAAVQHNWGPHDWTGYTASGRALKHGEDPNKAAWFEVTEMCGGPRGCGYKRTFQMGWHGRRLTRTTEYTYSDRNPHLVSPAGISETGMSVRTEMADTLRGATILNNTRVEIAPAGNTKRALKATARGAA